MIQVKKALSCVVVCAAALSGFAADDFVDVAESLGATYIVITSKHHDGFCM